MAGGFFSERWLGVAEPRMDQLETWSQMKYKRFIDAAGGWVRYQELLQALDRASERLGVSIANVACRCMLEAPSVGGIIVGARLGQSEHIEETVGLFGFEIDEESREEINSAVEEFDPIPGDCGDEYRKPPS